jgi:hypothetical protein
MFFLLESNGNAGQEENPVQSFGGLTRRGQNAETQMRKLKIIEHISLDGVIQASGEDDFPYADWTVPYRTPAGRDELFAAHGEHFDLLLGRHTYDMWSDFWPKAPSSPMADGFNAATKYIVTHRPEGPVRGPWTGHRRGHSPHQVARWTGPYTLG